MSTEDLASQMSEAQLREEEWEAACEQFRKSQAESVRNQLQTSIEIIAELTGQTFEEAGMRVARRAKEKGKSEAR